MDTSNTTFGSGDYGYVMSIEFGSADIKMTYFDTRTENFELDFWKNHYVQEAACLYNSKMQPLYWGSEAIKNQYSKNTIFSNHLKSQLTHIVSKDETEYTTNDHLVIKSSADILAAAVHYTTERMTAPGASLEHNLDKYFVISLDLPGDRGQALVRRIIIESGIVSDGADFDKHILLLDDSLAALQYFRNSPSLAYSSFSYPLQKDAIYLICDFGAGGIKLDAYKVLSPTDMIAGQTQVFTAYKRDVGALRLVYNFREVLLDKLFGSRKEEIRKQYEQEIAEMMQKEYNLYKIKNFGVDNQEEEMYFSIPTALQNASQVCCHDSFVRKSSFASKPGDKELILTFSELKKAFDPLVDTITQFFKEQLQKFDKSELHETVFIGGLSSNIHIYSAISEVFADQGFKCPFKIKKKPVLSFNVYESLTGSIQYSRELIKRNKPLPTIRYSDSWQDSPSSTYLVQGQYDGIVYIDIGFDTTRCTYSLRQKDGLSNKVWRDNEKNFKIPTNIHMFSKGAEQLSELPQIRDAIDLLCSGALDPPSSIEAKGNQSKKDKFRLSARNLFSKMKKPKQDNRDNLQHTSGPMNPTLQSIYQQYYNNKNLPWGITAGDGARSDRQICSFKSIDLIKKALMLYIGLLNEYIMDQIKKESQCQPCNFAYCIAVDDKFGINKAEWRSIVIASGIVSLSYHRERLYLLKRSEALALKNANPGWNKSLYGIHYQRYTFFVHVHVNPDTVQLAVHENHIAETENRSAPISAIAHTRDKCSIPFNFLLTASEFFWTSCSTSTIPYNHICEEHSNGTVFFNEEDASKVKKGFSDYLMTKGNTSLEFENEQKIHRCYVCSSGACYITMSSPDLFEHVIRPTVDSLARIITTILAQKDGHIRKEISELVVYLNRDFLENDQDYHFISKELIQSIKKQANISTEESTIQVSCRTLEEGDPKDVLSGMKLFGRDPSRRLVEPIVTRTYAARIISPNAKVYEVDGDDLDTRKQVKDVDIVLLGLDKDTRETHLLRERGLYKKFITSMGENTFIVEFYFSTKDKLSKKKYSIHGTEFQKFYACRFEYTQREDWDYPIEVNIYPNIGSVEVFVAYGQHGEKTEVYSYKEELKLSTFYI